MNLRRITLIAMSVCGVLLLCACAASAAEEGNGSANKFTEIFKWINFAIVAGVALWAFGAKLPPVFRAKAEAIGSAITKATALKAEADKRLVDAGARLARLEQEVAEMRAVAEKEAAADAQRIREMAKSDAEKISIAARAEIEAAERAARVELKAMVAKLSVDGAESLLAKQLNAQTQESLVSGFVKSLEGRPN
jgi:F0F1-type ATP synthase membrane subunit b/b'